MGRNGLADLLASANQPRLKLSRRERETSEKCKERCSGVNEARRQQVRQEKGIYVECGVRTSAKSSPWFFSTL